MSDNTNYERWRQLYEKVQGMQVGIERLNELTRALDMKIAGSKPVTKSPPPTELEQMQAELKEWKPYYEVNHQPDNSLLVAHYKTNWYLVGNLLVFGPSNKHARSILAAIQAAELERAGKIGWLVSQRLGGNYYFFENRIGTSKCTEGQPTLLAALLALRKWEEKGGA